jgi:hypothetical protein
MLYILVDAQNELVTLDANTTSSEWLDHANEGEALFTVEWVQHQQGVGGNMHPLAYREWGSLRAVSVLKGTQASPLMPRIRDVYAEWLKSTDREELSKVVLQGDMRRTRILWLNVARHLILGAGAILWIISLWLLPAYIREQRRFRRARIIASGQCPKCRYRFGIADPERCSECGEQVKQAAGEGGVEG